MTMPPSPSIPAIKSPPNDPNDFNGYSDYYRGESWGLDTIPVATFEKNKEDKDKTVHWFAEWKSYKNDPMPPEKIEEHKTHEQYSYNKLKGLGLIVGIIKYGPNKGRWICFFDADNETGKDAILKILGYDSIDNLKQDCVVEYHPSAPNKFHVFILSEVPFENFTGLVATSQRDLVKQNVVPGFEIKGKDSGLAYVTPSLYDNGGEVEGERYQLVEGSITAPAQGRLFSEFDVSECETRLEEICQLYAKTSLDGNGKTPVSELLSPDFVVTKGNNRKNHVIRVGMHYLLEDESTAEEKTKLWNEEHCYPPLSFDIYKEFPDAWKWAKKYHERNKENEDAESNNSKKSKESKKEQNIRTATKVIEDQEIQWFHDEYQTGYMRVNVDNHYEIYRVSRKDRKFKLFITKVYYEATGGSTLKDDELAEVLRALEAKATFSNICKNIHLRKSWAITNVDQKTFKEDFDKRMIFYDMCDPDWRCIMVDGENGTWHMLPTHPENMPFFRYQQRPQVTPKKPNEYPPNILDTWAEKMHIYDPEGKLLFKVWVIGFFIPDVPHPMLIPVGMQGAAKSTLCKQIQQITDPYAGDPLMLPDSKKEAAQQAHHRAILIYDNIEYEIPKWLSDFLSQLVTGITVSKRELYSDDNDILYFLMRTVVLNGLVTPKLKPDAKDRTIELPMERISDNLRKEQAEIDQWFSDNQEDIMGAIFDTLAKSLQIFPNVKLDKLPRMADFMRRGVSIARALAITENNEKRTPDILQQEFIDAYTSIKKKQNLDVIESSSVVDAFVRWCTEVLAQGKEGDKSAEYLKYGKVKYPTGLLLSILTLKGPQLGFDVKDKEWPKKPVMFSNELKSSAADVRNAHRIDIKVDRDSRNYSQVTITNLDFKPGGISVGSAEGNGGKGSPSPGGGEEDDRTKFPTNLGQSCEKVSNVSKSPEQPNSRPKIEENPGDLSGDISRASQVSSKSPEKIGQIHAQNEGLWRHGDSGDIFETPSLFSVEDSSSLKPSLIDEIKQSAIAVDPEWDNRPGMDDRLLQFNFYDSTGKNWVININRDCMGSEAILLDKVEHVIRSYKVVLTYYEKGKDMGFSKWHKRALANDRVSPIDMGFRKDGKGAYINLANHNYQPIKDIDLGLVYEMPIIENFLQNIYLSNELDEVARSLLGEGKLDGMSGEYFAELPLEKQVAYGMKDAELTYKLAGARNYAVLSVLEKIGQLFIGGEFADLVKMCSTGPTRWWSALFENKFNAIPSPTAIKRTGAKGELKGGHVEDINEIKEYRWVVVFDFRGQYPSIISRYNICFTTACCDCCKDDPSALVRTGLEEVDKNGWWFCRKKRGIVPQIVDALVAMRDDFKAKMKAANKAGNKELAQEYDVMQNACKLLANSLYGVFGETFFEFGDLRVANTITGYGRAKVIQMGKKIEQDYPGLRSIYHDTDSAFILGLEPTELEPALDENHATVMDIVTKISAPEGEEGGGLGLPLEYKKCYKKVMIKAPKNYMGLNAATGLIETVGLVGKKRNQCKLVRQAFEQEREYWKDDVSNDIVEDHIKQIVTKLDSGGQPLELLQEKVTIGHDPWTGYSLKAQHSSGCVLGKKYNRRIGESTPPYYLAKQEQEGDLAFTEDPTKIDYKKYRERLRTALEGILTVRGYKKERIDAILGLTKPPKPPKVKKEKKPRAPKRKKAKGKKPVSSSAEEDIKPVRMKRVWSMPSPRPFQIPAIAQLIKEECAGVPPEKVVDLFPYRATKDAFELLKSLPDSSISVFLLDPPYSQKQAKDLYNGHGKEYGIQIVSWESPKEYWTAFRKEIARVLEPSGKCITLAWNTQGTGKGLGFEITRILQVAHGGNRNDTVVTVDRKMGDFK